MKPVDAKIVEIVEESPSIRTFRFDVSFDDALPGQFVMVWVRGVDEVPMGSSYLNGITVQKVGDATSKLFDMKVGDSVGLRGPFGKGFTLPKKDEHILIIAGGVGAAPLGPLADHASECGAKVTTILGSRECYELVFEDRFSSAGELHITTDDGSAGTCGFVTTVLADLDISVYDRICVCGPEIMMANVMKVLQDKDALDRSEFSMHRYFKCAIGVCGACCMDPQGLRVCKDGPVLNGSLLIDSELGDHKRNSSSQRVRV